MKLREYAEKIIDMLDEYADLDVVYGADDEGNTFHRVVYHPSIGKLVDDTDFIQYDVSEEDDKEFWEPGEKPTAICIN